MKIKITVTKISITYFFVSSLLFCQTATCIEYVNTTIGSEYSGGATFVGACAPHGMVKLGPDTPLPQNTSGYVSNAPIEGFCHTHVSGTGESKIMEILFNLN